MHKDPMNFAKLPQNRYNDDWLTSVIKNSLQIFAWNWTILMNGLVTWMEKKQRNTNCVHDGWLECNLFVIGICVSKPQKWKICYAHTHNSTSITINSNKWHCICHVFHINSILLHSVQRCILRDKWILHTIDQTHQWHTFRGETIAFTHFKSRSQKINETHETRAFD